MSKWVDYDKYMKSEIWQMRRVMALERAGYKCHICGETSDLNVHHKTYEHLGNELPEELVVLCRTHHWMEHNPGEPVPADANKKNIKEKTPRNANKERGCKYVAHVLRKIDEIVASCDKSSMPLDKLGKILDWEAKIESHQNRCQECNPDVLWMYTPEERQAMRNAHNKERRARNKQHGYERRRKAKADKKKEIKAAKTGNLCPYAVGLTRKIERLLGNYDDKFRLTQEDRDKRNELEAALKKHVSKCDKCRGN